MRLLKIVVIIFLIYFIRRFIQVYRAMKRVQEEEARRAEFEARTGTPHPNKGHHSTIVDADFKVVD